MPKEVSYGAVIYRKEGKKTLYLLLYRKAHEHYKEMWDFPRGLIEKGETPEEDVIREVKEETGIKDLKFIEDFQEKIEWFYRKNNKLVFKEATYYLAGTKTEKVKLSFEHNGFKWCVFDEAMKLVT